MDLILFLQAMRKGNFDLFIKKYEYLFRENCEKKYKSVSFSLRRGELDLNIEPNKSP